MSFSGLPNREANALEGRRLLKLSRRRILLTITMAAPLGLGMFLRIFPSSGFKRVGFDEHGYMVFVKQIQAAGVWNYDAVVKVYVERAIQTVGRRRAGDAPCLPGAGCRYRRGASMSFVPFVRQRLRLGC